MPRSSTSRPRPTAEPPDLRRLVEKAAARRATRNGASDTNAYRVVHGAADGLPELTLDRFGEAGVLSLYEADLDERAVTRALADVLPWMTACYVKRRPVEASRAQDREQVAPSRPLHGEPRDRVDVHENGVRYQVRPAAGLSVGLFLDMREVRAWLREGVQGARVLNLFAYTCSLGVAAMLGGAARVLNLDASRPYLDWGKDNYRLNDLPVNDYDFVFGDVFDWLNRMARRGEQWDLVIADPPPYSSTRSSRFSAERDLSHLAAMCARVVAPGGALLAATNAIEIPEPRFDHALADGIRAARREPDLVERWHEPGWDFPVPSGGRPYLKVVLLALD